MGANDKLAATFHGGDTMKRITIEEGPLAGNEYDVPDDTTVLDIPVDGGRYTVGPKHAPWHPDEEPAPKPRASRKPKAKTAEVDSIEQHNSSAVLAEPQMGYPGFGPETAPTADTPE